MLKGIQSFYKALGDSGCYLLSLLDLAEEYELARGYSGNWYEDEVGSIYTFCETCSKIGAIKLDFDNFEAKDNFYIQDPTKILNLLTGSKWDVQWRPASYVPSKDDYVIKCYKRGKYTHFRREVFDSLQDSKTVKYGKLDSYRIFKEV